MRYCLRLLVSVLGSSIVGLGVGICVTTGLGADALGVLWEGLARHLPLTVGQASLAVTFSCFLLVFLIDKKELGLATLLNPVATSLLTDWTIRQFQPADAFLGKLLIVVLGIACIGIGSGIAAATQTGKESYIALSFALSNRLGQDLAKVRMVLDTLCFIAGMILGGKFMLGPIIGVLLIGPLLKLSSQFFGNVLKGLLVDEAI